MIKVKIPLLLYIELEQLLPLNVRKGAPGFKDGYLKILNDYQLHTEIDIGNKDKFEIL